MGAKKCTYNDFRHDSKFEAMVAHELEMKKRAGEIKEYDKQFRIDMTAYSQCLSRSLSMSHKVDFRVHNLDGTYTLLEAKGYETADYKWRVKWLDAFWLPLHPDHDYLVIYPNSKRGAWTKRFG